MMDVFLVDDDKIALNGLERMIHWDKVGARVVGTALTGTDALTQIKKVRPQMVLSDIKMPGLDGLELSRYIHKYLPEIRIVLISGHSEFDYAQQAIKYQVVDYILKPITRDKISDIENRLSQLSGELNADRMFFTEKFSASIQRRILEALRAGDDAKITILLEEKLLLPNLSNRARDLLGIRLLDYLYDYLSELGRESKVIQDEKQLALSKYWSYAHPEDKNQFLIEHYAAVITQLREWRSRSLNPIVVFATKYIQEHYTDCNFNVSALAERMHLSLSYLSTSYKQITGRNISGDLTDLRMEKAKTLLMDITIPIAAIAAKAGYDDARYFAKSFKRNLHMTPSEYRNLHCGQGSDT